MALVVVWLIWMIRRLRDPPPARRGKTPASPEDAGRHPHARARRSPPIFAAVGLPCSPRPRLRRPDPVLGVLALVLTLLYWLAEACGSTTTMSARPCRRSRPSSTTVRRQASTCPGPSFRPFLGAIGVTILIVRARLRRLAAAGRRHRPDPDPGRLARRRASRSTARRSKPTGPATSERPRPADARRLL